MLRLLESRGPAEMPALRWFRLRRPAAYGTTTRNARDWMQNFAGKCPTFSPSK